MVENAGSTVRHLLTEQERGIIFPPMPIRDRIVEMGRKPASQFTAHPLNWRRHPQAQRDALAGVLSSVGWAGAVVENRRTGHLIDGHERVWQAFKAGDADVPFVQVDVDEAEPASN